VKFGVALRLFQNNIGKGLFGRKRQGFVENGEICILRGFVLLTEHWVDEMGGRACGNQKNNVYVNVI
jgi:hypothetical protein